ncbi:hypothetical protein thalar_02835 [Litoreibacter arenae DSM 19593]|uniref:Uncharacterized protein n=1 Tax=Litoreibacter arenae DSM 19593 TaxID=1123360 RepID=S9RGB6_9RHOB|nr:hypothetical protein thalar_02835 [Litoreibacter arenae DSM 19593]
MDQRLYGVNAARGLSEGRSRYCDLLKQVIASLCLAVGAIDKHRPRGA